MLLSIYGGILMKKMTLLAKKQIFGDQQLDILRKYGTNCAITDFAILLGGFVSGVFYTNEGTSLKDRTGWWWTKTSYDNDAHAVNEHGDRICYYVNRRYGGARSALPYSSISSISSNGVRGRNGILEVEYGEYPQTIVSENFAITLERAYQNGAINQTGKMYTTDSVKYDDYDTPFQARTHIEYEYNGKKYIRFVGDSNGAGEILSDGRKVEKGKVYWVEVEPIKWLVDKRANIALCKNIIVSGIQFNEKYYDGNFKNTRMYKFLNEIFAKDIIPSKIGEKKRESSTVESKENEPLTETEKLLKLISVEVDKRKVKIDNIKFEKIKKEFYNKLKQVYDIVETLITKKKEFNTKINLTIGTDSFHKKQDVISYLYEIDLKVEEYLQKEKYINDIVEFSNKIKSNINIDLVDITNIHNFSLSAIECIYLLYSKVDEILNKINGIEGKDVINELNILVNKVVNIINGNIEIEKSSGLYVIGFESLKNIIISEFHKFNIKLDEYNGTLEIYNREQQMLNDLKDSISK